MSNPKNIQGRRNAWGGCLRCGDTWNWKPRFSIPLTESCGTFPLCKECGEQLTNDEILMWVGVIILRWEKDAEHSPRLKDDPIQRDEWLGFAKALLERWREGRQGNEDPSEFQARLRRSVSTEGDNHDVSGV